MTHGPVADRGPGIGAAGLDNPTFSIWCVSLAENFAILQI